MVVTRSARQGKGEAKAAPPPSKKKRKGEDSGVATSAISKKRKKAKVPTLSVTPPSTPVSQWNVVFSGEFNNKASLVRMITENGGTISKSISAKTTHIVAGGPGKTAYGQKTGF